jgi:hypothetical protein
MMFELILSFYIFIVEKLMHDSSNQVGNLTDQAISAKKCFLGQVTDSMDSWLAPFLSGSTTLLSLSFVFNAFPFFSD